MKLKMKIEVSLIDSNQRTKYASIELDEIEQDCLQSTLEGSMSCNANDLAEKITKLKNKIM